jgi:hypothetical protein
MHDMTYQEYAERSELQHQCETCGWWFFEEDMMPRPDIAEDLDFIIF